MLTLESKLTAILSAAFKRLGLDQDLGRVEISARPDLAQFQCNGAMRAAKQQNPHNARSKAVVYSIHSI